MQTRQGKPAREYSMVLCTNGRSDGRESVKGLMDYTGLSGMLSISEGTLADKNTSGDIVVAIFDVEDDVAEYLANVAYLKLVKKIPVVFGFVVEGARTALEGRIGELPADDTVFMPISAQDFHRMVMTHVVSLKLEEDTHRPSVSRSRQSLGSILVEHNLITSMQLKKALEYQKGSGLRLGEALTLLGYISEEQKNHFLASQLGVGLATAKQFAAAQLDIVSLVPEHIAKRFNCIALERDDDTLTVAMTDVLNLQHLDALRDATNLTINPVLGTHEDIKTSVERYYQELASQRDASDLMADFGEDVEYMAQEAEDVSVEEAAAAGAELGIIKLVNMLITNAVRERASDIHIEPMEKELIVRYRVDGILRKVMSPPKRSLQAIVTRIKILSELDIAERRLPQDGRMVVRIGRKEIDIRVSILPTVFGEKAVLRILDKEAFEKSVTNLGFRSHDLEVFKRCITYPHGMIIVTGPTGSGKSTTLYSAAQHVKSVVRNMVTVEDPVEFHMDGITQVQVNPRIGLTFANALRSILRQDPDVILIGEIRDAETADIAVKMALTGHLVFSTLHTNDAVGAIPRLADIGIPPVLIGSALNLIVAQRLVRKICTKCKTVYRPDEELLQQLKLQGKDYNFYRGEGCVACNGTGFLGRTALFEMIEVSRSVRSLIIRSASARDLQDKAEEEGMQTLRKVGIQLALEGTTTIEQVLAVTTQV